MMYLDQTVHNRDVLNSELDKVNFEYYNRKLLYDLYELNRIPKKSTFMSHVILDRFGFKQFNLFPVSHKSYVLRGKSKDELSDDERSYLGTLNKWSKEFERLLKKYLYDPISLEPSLYGVKEILNYKRVDDGDSSWWYKILFNSGLEVEIRNNFPFTVMYRFNVITYDLSNDAPYNILFYQDSYNSLNRCIDRASDEITSLFNLLFNPRSMEITREDYDWYGPVKKGCKYLDLDDVSVLNNIDPLEITFINRIETSPNYTLPDGYPYSFAESFQKLLKIDFDHIIPFYIELHINNAFPNRRKQKLFESALNSYAQIGSPYVSILKGSTIYFEFPNRPKCYIYNKTNERFERAGQKIPFFITRFEIKFEKKDISKLAHTRRADHESIRYYHPYLSGRPVFSLAHRTKLFNSFLASIFEEYYPLAGVTEFIRGLSDKSTPFLDQRIPKLGNLTMRDVLIEVNDYKDLDNLILESGYSAYHYKKYVQKLSNLKLLRFNRSLNQWILTPLGALCLDYHLPLSKFFYSLESSENFPIDESEIGPPIVVNNCIHSGPKDVFSLLQMLFFESLNYCLEVSDG